MKYFLHDTNANQDEKLTELFLRFGYEGIGLFYVALEKIAAQEKPIKTDVLKAQLNVGKRLEKCWSFMESLGILSASNGETFNERILSYSEKYKIKKDKNNERIAKWRENHANGKPVTHYNGVTQHVSNAPKVNRSKVKEIDINTDANASLVGKPTDKKFNQEDLDLKKEFEEIQLPESAKDAWALVKGWIEEKQPRFIEPYITAWNIFASFYNLAAIKKINDSRRKKFATRIQDPGFNFFEILAKAKGSSFLKESDWFGFDWIFKNEMNYLKILEGNYK